PLEGYHSCLHDALPILAMLYEAQGDNVKALPLLLQALDIYKQTLGDKPPDYAHSLNNLAVLYQAQGDYAKALPLFLQALEIKKQTLAGKHRNYAPWLIN